MKSIKNNFKFSQHNNSDLEFLTELEKKEEFCCQADNHGNQGDCFIVLCGANNQPPQQPMPDNFWARLFRWLFGEDLFN